MITETTDIIKRYTVAELVESYRVACDEIRGGLAMLQSAQDRLKAAYGEKYSFDLLNRHEYGAPGDRIIPAIKRVKCDAWKMIAEKMELRRCLSSAREKELNTQLDNPEKLPEIDEGAILAMFQNLVANHDVYLTETIREVYDWLRPYRDDGYKTNSPYCVGRRVILGWMVSRAWSGGGFRVHYNEGTRQKLRNLDNVFSMLDGKGGIKSYNGPLSDAIESAPGGVGETEYFRFKCYGNGNLHLEFRRDDLLQEFNRVAGGGSLGSPDDRKKKKASRPAPAAATVHKSEAPQSVEQILAELRGLND